MFNFKRDKSITASLPQDQMLHGIKVKKLPLGQYIKALHAIENLPEIMLKELFPGMKPDQVLDKLKAIDEDTVYQLVSRLLRVVPEQFLRLVAELIDTEFEHLQDNLTPKELLEVLRAFWAVNDMTDFFVQIKMMMGGWKANPLAALKLGSKK
ncbi:hypothetical protein [Paenibacillus wynnii]|uniref:Uncharacterized protein n=1 Tax=Paenibacillus wynnii TaxID=268407 RepID=A0A098MDI8_9BACL|nr:hypothetical protein [Paenibacillus wynnii]KGE20629.1 hypothetical protein PWYN_15725 [Paenibacillus wynnii]KGE21111.1 hypothetical protein PWYN_02995 [Paenibacillus wynnii]